MVVESRTTFGCSLLNVYVVNVESTLQQSFALLGIILRINLMH